VGSNTTRLKFATLASALIPNDNWLVMMLFVWRLQGEADFLPVNAVAVVEEKDVRLAGEETGHIGWLEAVG
jgi:hypothetical protein